MRSITAVVELLLKGLNKCTATDLNYELRGNLLASFPSLLSILSGVAN